MTKKKTAQKKPAPKKATPKKEAPPMKDQTDFEKLEDEETDPDFEQAQDEEVDDDAPEESNEEQDDEEEKEESHDEDETSDEEERIPKDSLQCPKCHGIYDEDTAREMVAHVVRKPDEEVVTFYCPACSLSWLERSAAKLAKAK